MLTVAEWLLLELDFRIGVILGAPTSCCIVGGVTMGGEEVAVALESAGAEVPADDADWEEVVELDSMERLFCSLTTAFAALASPGAWWPDPDSDSDVVASAAVFEALDVLETDGGIVGVGR